ncbi:MAG: TlyA family RNA methyltransferase, partial [Acidimicrobiales bacterium]
VLVGGAVAERPSRLVAAGEPLELLGPAPPFVGRGGDKLDAALDRFALDVRGATALDAGASTGGFTDCLLQRGATRVVAVDVGHGQLHPRLRDDPRVVVLERTHVRSLTVETLVGTVGPGVAPVDVVTADLSFISLTAAVPILAGPVARTGAPMVLLVKPQFEVGRADASRGRGVVRDPGLWRQALDAVASSLVAATAAIMGAMPSPVTGAAGNTEFLLHAVAHAGPAPAGTTALLEAAVGEATVARGSAAPGGTAGAPG